MLKNCKTFNKIANTNMTKNDDIWQHFPAADKEIHTNFFMESLCQIIISFYDKKQYNFNISRDRVLCLCNYKVNYEIKRFKNSFL